MLPNNFRTLLTVSMLGLVVLACLLLSGLLSIFYVTRLQATAIPGERPASFEIQSPTPTVPVTATPLPTVANLGLPETDPFAPLGDAPTHTPTRVVIDPTATPELTPTPIVLEPTPTPVPTVIVLAPTPTPATEPAPPLQGGTWDFEADYVPWANPYGEPCPGASVASGWIAFAEEGQYGSSCFNENLYGPNVQSGRKSQEITFDFIAANSGVFRIIDTIPGHQYSIKAYAKNDWSIAPVQMSLGIDLTGGGDWEAGTVEWYPWQQPTQDNWGLTEQVVTATGDKMTIFLRGFHPMADQGGKTVVDNVSVTDLGP